jgi:CHAT domain-containing protein/tetratricopeptide (TPR) repeat protein
LVFKYRGDYCKARAYHEQALAMRQRLYSTSKYPAGHPELAQSLNNLGCVLQALGDYGKAQGYFEQALGASRQGIEDIPFHNPVQAAKLLTPTPETGQMAGNRSALLRRQLPADAEPEPLRACADAYALAAALHERLRGEVLRDPDSKLQHGAMAASLLADRLGILDRLARATDSAAVRREAFLAMEQTRARVLLESLGEAHAARLAGLPADLHREEDRLREALRSATSQLLVARTRPSPEPGALAQLWQRQQEAEAGLDQFARRLAQTQRAYAGLRFPSPCTVAQARACLGQNEIAVLFALGREQSFALVVQPGAADAGLTLVALPGSDVLSPAVRTLLDPELLKSDSRCRTLGSRLYDLLFRPLEPYIQNKDLVLGPDGQLWELPFELLVQGRTAEKPGHYLVETRQLRYTPSLTVLHLIAQWEQGRQLPQETLWALGDPVFSRDDPRARGDLSAATRELLERYAEGRTRGDSWQRRLPATLAEVTAIAKLTGAGADDVVTDLRASERVLKTASEKGILARKRYVHLATHGILGLGQERPPSLVLSLVGNDGGVQLGGVNDGFLTLPEVTHLRLNADLVVLSACQTGKGALRAGEGIVGLSQAFLYAGSRGVVCSLWNVDDTLTATLMQALYEKLEGGNKPSAEALALARRQLIASGEAPFYWAPFILIGK